MGVTSKASRSKMGVVTSSPVAGDTTMVETAVVAFDGWGGGGGHIRR